MSRNQRARNNQLASMYQSRSNIRLAKTEKPITEEKDKISFTLFDSPLIQVQTLILEDRVQYSVIRFIDRLKQTELWKDPQIQKLCNILYQRKANPAKCGVIGKYNRELLQNLIQEEQEAFGDVCEEYDQAIAFPEKVLRAKLKEYAQQVVDPDVDLDILCDACMCEIIASYTYSYHQEILEKCPVVDRYLRNMKWNGDLFHFIEGIIDQIVVVIAHGKPIDFTESEGFNRAYNTYASTINNCKRLKEQTEKIGTIRDEKIKNDPNFDLLNNNIFSSAKVRLTN